MCSVVLCCVVLCCVDFGSALASVETVQKFPMVSAVFDYIGNRGDRGGETR